MRPDGGRTWLPAHRLLRCCCFVHGGVEPVASRFRRYGGKCLRVIGFGWSALRRAAGCAIGTHLSMYHASRSSTWTPSMGGPVACLHGCRSMFVLLPVASAVVSIQFVARMDGDSPELVSESASSSHCRHFFAKERPRIRCFGGVTSESSQFFDDDSAVEKRKPGRWNSRDAASSLVEPVGVHDPRVPMRARVVRMRVC